MTQIPQSDKSCKTDGLELFEYLDSYPDHPGWQKTDTSHQAAKDMLPQVGTLMHMVLGALRENGPLASFELAVILQKSYRSIQPRTSDLRNKGLIEDSGERRIDPETDKNVIVWELVK